MMQLGLPEFAYAASVGLVVGVALGFRLRSDNLKTLPILVTHAIWCGLLGAISLPLMTLGFEADSRHSKSAGILLLTLIAGGGSSIIFGTPFALVISRAIANYRSQRSQQK
jgi:multidrug transporter EmrE-like cation transporter